MSINSLANAAAARRTDFAPVGKTPEKLAEIVSGLKIVFAKITRQSIS
jgi:hypothetical protein